MAIKFTYHYECDICGDTAHSSQPYNFCSVYVVPPPPFAIVPHVGTSMVCSRCLAAAMEPLKELFKKQ